MLHGLIAITAIMGLCLTERERDAVLTWRGIVLLMLPALAMAVNSVAGLYCIGVVGILLFRGRLDRPASWLQITVMLCMFLVAWEIMGYGHGAEAGMATIKRHFSLQWWPLTIGFTAGLGLRVIAFRWISKSLTDPLSALFLFTVVSLLSFSTLIQLDGSNERYGWYFLQCIFSVFAFSRFTKYFWRVSERSQLIAEWLILSKRGLIVLEGYGILIGIVAFRAHSRTGITAFGIKILLSFLLLSLLIGASALLRSRRYSNVCSATLAIVLLIGFLAWITPWLNFGMGRMKMDISLTPGEVHGLHRLGELAAPNERFATNKHAIDSLAANRERSYSYSALSQRPVLLEGYLDHAETALPWFGTLLHDNDLMFNTYDPETLRRIAETWHVRWLVARPGTDIALRRPLPPWLVEQNNCGNIRIYRVD
jgi:hypothetical protein